MEEELEELRSTVEELVITEESEHIDKMYEIAHDIARLSIDHLSGDRLRKGMALAVAVTELADVFDESD